MGRAPYPPPRAFLTLAELRRAMGEPYRVVRVSPERYLKGRRDSVWMVSCEGIADSGCWFVIFLAGPYSQRGQAERCAGEYARRVFA